MSYSNNGQFETNGEVQQDSLNPDKLKEYFVLIRSNLLPVILIFSACLIITVLYVTNATDIYRATTTIKIENPKGSILEIPFATMTDVNNDRFISNQIEVLKSFYIRDIVSQALLDSLKHYEDLSKFHVLVRRKEKEISPKDAEALRKSLLSAVKVEQKRGLDAVDISVESPSFNEAQLIANTYASMFVEYSREMNRQDIKNVKQFLESEKEKKYKDLNIAEATLEDFQNRNGIISLPQQANELVQSISEYEAQKNSTDIELKANERVLSSLRSEYSQKDPALYDYVQGKISEPYLQELQTQIAKLEIEKDVALSAISDPRAREKIKNDYTDKIKPLNEKLNSEISVMKQSLLANTPEEMKELTSRILDASLKNQSLRTISSNISPILSQYESEFAKLPSQSITLAKLERDRLSNEKLYLILEEKYQEATINERARLGNASIIDPGLDNFGPVKPNRSMILTVGIIAGLVLGVGYVFTVNYFDRSIKNPDEIEKKGASVLAWVPSVEGLTGLKNIQAELVVLNNPKASVSESFKALRTRVQFAKLEDKPLQTILVTSSIPSEGKSFISSNLASSFAQADKKVLLLDCDLRKPRVHNVFGVDRYPGLSDYLFSKVEYEDILRETSHENLSFITGGTIPPNPSELLGSLQMKQFLAKLRQKFDIIIIDSPPFISVTDAELLFNVTDGTILVAQASKTPMDAFMRVFTRMNNMNKHNLLGVVLNNFNVKTAYGYYYNYYYYYAAPEKREKKATGV